MTSLGIQIPSNSGANTVVISELNPEAYYYVSPTTVEAYAGTTAGQTKLIFAATKATLIQYDVMIIINTSKRGMQYTVASVSTADVMLYGDCTSNVTANVTYVAFYRSARSQVTKCSTTYDCVSISCTSIGDGQEWSEKPTKMPGENSLRINTGLIDQSISLNECTIWNSAIDTRFYRAGQLQILLHKWNSYQNNVPVFLTITAEYGTTAAPRMYNKIFNYPYKTSTLSDIDIRGMLAGFALSNTGEIVFARDFTITFSESWIGSGVART